jgi:hypothetical protein
VKNITDALGYSKVCARWLPRSLTITKLQKEVHSGLLSCYEANGENFFCQGSSLEMKHGSITFNHRQKDSQWHGIIQLLLRRRSLRPPLQKLLMATVFCNKQFTAREGYKTPGKDEKME